MNHTEFFEGVRALLIDKDKNPKWKYSSVNEVKQEDIDFFFKRDDKLNLDLNKFHHVWAAADNIINPPLLPSLIIHVIATVELHEGKR